MSFYRFCEIHLNAINVNIIILLYIIIIMSYLMLQHDSVYE